MIDEIKWAYQRVVRGYDDRIFWGFDYYFADFLPAFEDFCSHYLTLDYCELNPERKEVMETTLKLIKEYNNSEMNKDDYAVKLWEYIGAHMTWYWD